MKLVWECDFCSETNKDKGLIRTHENICSFNPKNKVCYTCEKRIDDQIMQDGCSDKSVSSNYLFDVLDEKNPCEYWIESEWSKKKNK